jgi:hypothetical protein
MPEPTVKKALVAAASQISTPEEFEEALYQLWGRANFLVRKEKAPRLLAYWGAAHRLVRQASDELKEMRQ